MPIYPTLAVLAAVGVVCAELLFFRSGLFRTPVFWITMVIVFGFMVVVDGWLTKLSAPIVIYNDADTSGVRPIWDILIEEYAYAFAMLTFVILLWHRSSDERVASRTTDGGGS
jgi:lycopene cyclase domain-containing protein